MNDAKARTKLALEYMTTHIDAAEAYNEKHEYDAMFPACLRKTHQIASEWGMPVDHVGLICWVQKPLGQPAPLDVSRQ